MAARVVSSSDGSLAGKTGRKPRGENSGPDRIVEELAAAGDTVRRKAKTRDKPSEIFLLPPSSVRFLVDASLPRSAERMLRELGNDAVDVRDAYARSRQRALVARDFDFADIHNYPPVEYAGIVVLQLPEDTTAPQIVKLLEPSPGARTGSTE